MTFWETVERGEYVMIALAVFLIVSLCIWWIRVVKLRRQKNTYRSLMQRIRDQVVEGDIDNARQICNASQSPGAIVVKAGLQRVGKPMSEVREAMGETALLEKSKMTKGDRWLRAIAVISPLLGLGGTLVGIIDRLRDLGEGGEIVELATICSALAPTIVTTVAGLGVGIFALLFHTLLEGSIDSAQRRLDEVGVEFIDLLNEPA